MRLLILLSGSGTTFQNLLDRTREGRLRAEIVGVISSRADVLGVERAKKANIPVEVISPKPKESFSQRVFDTARAYRPDLVCLAGWLHLVKIPSDFQHRVLNIHPSLLPAFGGHGMYGHHVHEAVLKYGAKVSGCTVHFADESYDTGPIIAQQAVPVKDDDTAETLAKRVFAAECEAYPEAVQLFCERQWHLDGRRVVFSQPPG
jgi:phosphoribosylglycinamide formyltransferase 1